MAAVLSNTIFGRERESGEGILRDVHVATVLSNTIFGRERDPGEGVCVAEEAVLYFEGKDPLGAA